MSIIVDPIPFNNEVVSIKPKHNVRKDAPRYVACLGDFMQPSDKQALRDLGTRSGGLRVGPSETEGCPTMWRTNFIIRRGCFTPLELTGVLTKLDEVDKDAKKNQLVINGKDAPPLPSKNVFPSDDIGTLTDDSFRSMGVVELSKLIDVQWGESIAQKLNKHFFPEMKLWLDGVAEFPTLLKDYETLIRKAVIENDVHDTTQRELMESARVFRAYATRQIEQNRSRIMSTREKDMGGFSYQWEERTRLFAAQLSITLEKEDSIRPQEEAGPDRSREVAAMEEANTLKREELEMKREEIRFAREGHAPPKVEPYVATMPVVEEEAAEVTTLLCDAPTGSGNPCKFKAVNNSTRCHLAAHKLVESANEGA